MKKLKKYINKKNVIIFDLDGVLLNSKINMKFAWKYVSKKNNVKVSFNQYFKHVGLPFMKILEEIGIKKNKKKIKTDYAKGSVDNIFRIKIYPNVLKVLKKLREKNKKIALFTSKDTKRVKLFIKKFNLKFDHIECGRNSVRGKPFPDQINRILKKCKSSKMKAVYIGDMYHDYLSAKNAKIDFIFAKYGYGGLRSIEITKFIRKIDELI